MFISMPYAADRPANARRTMKHFRFFTLDSMGRIDRGFERDCYSEAEALTFAKQQSGAASVEVWFEKRMIAKLHPQQAR